MKKAEAKKCITDAILDARGHHYLSHGSEGLPLCFLGELQRRTKKPWGSAGRYINDIRLAIADELDVAYYLLYDLEALWERWDVDHTHHDPLPIIEDTDEVRLAMLFELESRFP